jgi:hypothetical protein
VTLEERLHRERERNECLAKEIADLKAEQKSRARLAGMRVVGHSLMHALELIGPLAERERQKAESDRRLAELQREQALVTEGGQSGLLQEQISGYGVRKGQRGEQAAAAKHSPPESSPSTPCDFAYSADYASVQIRGRTFRLTRRQSYVIRILHSHYRQGTPTVGDAYILDKMGTGKRLRDVFKSNIGAWKALVRREGPGRVRLNLPDSPHRPA